MSRLSRRFLLTALCLVPAAAKAQDEPAAVGTWTLDRDAWNAELDRLIPELMSQLPADKRKAMKASGFDLAGELRQSLSRGLDGSFELHSDGSLVAYTGRGEPDGEGRWRPAEGGLVELTLPDERLTLRGEIEVDRMRLYVVPEEAQTAADPIIRAVVEAMIIELVRRQG